MACQSVSLRRGKPTVFSKGSKTFCLLSDYSQAYPRGHDVFQYNGLSFHVLHVVHSSVYLYRNCGIMRTKTLPFASNLLSSLNSQFKRALPSSKDCLPMWRLMQPHSHAPFATSFVNVGLVFSQD